MPQTYKIDLNRSRENREIIASLIAQGKSTADILGTLKARGIKTPKGKTPDHSYLANVRASLKKTPVVLKREFEDSALNYEVKYETSVSAPEALPLKPTAKLPATVLAILRDEALSDAQKVRMALAYAE